jgi:hypothetical protein
MSGKKNPKNITVGTGIKAAKKMEKSAPKMAKKKGK